MPARRSRSRPTAACAATRCCSAASLWAEARALDGDEGARVLMRRHRCVEVDCDGTGDPTDVDTLDDLHAIDAPRRRRRADGDRGPVPGDVPVDEAWRVLLDIERIAPCLPGAQLQEIEGDEYRGIVKVKVGPITAEYKGTATLESRSTRRATAIVIDASGRDTRGQGNASATISSCSMRRRRRHPVDVDTDLSITGKVAQFGRGVIADVSAKLLAPVRREPRARRAERATSWTSPTEPKPRAAEATPSERGDGRRADELVAEAVAAGAEPAASPSGNDMGAPNPSRRITGCARAASGHATTPLSAAMNSRLFIRSPRRRGRAWLAAQ